MFGNKLREARINKGMTLDEVADTYNKKYDGKLNKSTLSRYENGLQEPMISVVQKLASVLDVSVDYLLDKESFERADVTYFIVRYQRLWTSIPTSDSREKSTSLTR